MLQIFIAFKNPSPWPGLNLRTLGPLVSKLSITLPRQITHQCKYRALQIHQAFSFHGVSDSKNDGLSGDLYLNVDPTVGCLYSTHFQSVSQLQGSIRYRNFVVTSGQGQTQNSLSFFS
jgi:hypothetical protein